MSVKLKETTTGAGKDLVLLHGWGVNSGVWQPLVAQLKNDFCITCIDLPGYGLNQQNLPQPYDLENLAQTIAKHIPEHSVLVGWSLGGLVAQQIALDFPEKLTKLGLICSSPKFAREDDWPGIEHKVLEFFMQQLDENVKKTLDRFLAIQAMGSPSARQDVKAIKQAVQAHPEPNKAALVAGLAMLNNVDLTARLNELSVPCHLFLGRLDTLVPVSLKEKLAEIAPQIEVDILTNASHAPFISDTASFAECFKKVFG